MSELTREALVAEAERLERIPFADRFEMAQRDQFWMKHGRAFLSLLASEGEKVKALEHRITELEAGDACFTPTQADVYMAVVKDRDRLRGMWEALAGWSALPEAVNDKMDELETQR